MSADILRSAAKVLRERAEAATPGPWWNDTRLHNVIFSGTGLSTDVAVTEDFDKREDATFIATMHPGVALALADWLDQADDVGDGFIPDEAFRVVEAIFGGAR